MQSGKIFSLCVMLLIATQSWAGPALDVRPAQCPNLVDRDARGLVAVALIGDTDFNAARVDTASLELSREDGTANTVAPLTGRRGAVGRLIDVTAPAPMGMCSTYGADGQRDLVVLFGQAAMVAELDLAEETQATVCLSGTVVEGDSFRVCDTIDLISIGMTTRPFGDLDTRPVR